MDVTVEYEVTREEFRRGVKAVGRRRRRIRVLTVVGGCVLGVALVAVGLREAGMVLIAWTVLIAVAVAVARQYGLARGAEQACQRVEVRLTDATLRRATALEVSEIRWSVVIRVTRTPEFWLFHISKRHTFVLPRRVFDQALRAEIDAFVARRWDQIEVGVSGRDGQAPRPGDRWAQFRGLTWWQTVLALLPMALLPIGGAVGGGIGGVGAAANLKLARTSMPTMLKASVMTGVVALTYGTGFVAIAGVRSMFFGHAGPARNSATTPTPTHSLRIQPPGDAWTPAPGSPGSSCSPRQANAGDPVLLRGLEGVVLRQPSVIHATGAELSWSPYPETDSTTLTGLIEYQVHRGTCPTFEPSASTLVSEIPAGTTSFVDTTENLTSTTAGARESDVCYYMVVVKTRAGLIPGPTRLVRLPRAGSTTVVIPAVVATTLSSRRPTSVFNTLSNLEKSQPGVDVGVEAVSAGTARAVFGFGRLTGVPRDARVSDARLNLTVQGVDQPGTRYKVHAVTHPFIGSQVSWKRASAAVPWTRPGGDYTAARNGEVPEPGDDRGRRSFDATAIVRGWMASPGTNHGLLLKVADETTAHGLVEFAGLNATKSDPAQLPALAVTFLPRTTETSTPPPMRPGRSAPRP